MNTVSAVFLMPDSAAEISLQLAKQAGIQIDAVVVNNLEALERAFLSPHQLLLSFGTGVIVPPWIVELPSLIALNVHAASPAYPGRDPHHFAIYDGVSRYGATLHYMTKSVDAGPIVDVALFDVPPNVLPHELLDLANDAGYELIDRFFYSLTTFKAPVPLTQYKWGNRKTTRKMFLELCRIDSSMTKHEVDRRYRATFSPGYQNLYTDIHNYRFCLKGRIE